MTPPSRFSVPVLASFVLLASCGGAPPADAPAAPPAAQDAASPPAAPTSVNDGVYTADQALRGRQVFRTVCSECHGTADFRGETFYLSFEGVTVGRFVDGLVETMPDGDPGSLPLQQYLDVTAYIFQLNGFPAGTVELSDDAARLAAIRIERMAEGGP